ncbi:nicotinamidase-related amidase [Glaciihabitans tibetensis]|uniref:Nicotinamidase-related amidase n=1 Tax=Glaciihabitans tibetensis TaxID=1266600 RepID=A0A2T0VBW2_9MICO|nr:isochorismatase family protein [Glaciihabitans tibetensis]PRY67676.1 nicotinamidase-related amidase [Glaciihabitans tibetensis]
MPITNLDPTVALIVVDLQAGTAANPTAHPIADVVARNVELLAAFRERGLPVVLANVTGTPAGQTQYGAGARAFPAEWSAMLPALDQQPSDLTVSRATWSAFAGTDLDMHLRALGVTQVVLAGIATSFGIESTARQAYDLGYSVVVAVDAITDPRLEAHTGSVERVFPALGQLDSTHAIVALLETSRDTSDEISTLG